MKDKAISLKAAIKAIRHTEVNFSVESEIDFTKHKREVQEIINNILDAQEKMLKQLPPVTPQPCEDAISRQAVLDYIDKMPSELTADGRIMIRRRTLEEYISDTLPPVNPQPKTGRWITSDYIRFRCSKCGCLKYDTDSNFCPNCGADMRGEQHG